MTRLLVVGYGSTLRGDDAVGRLAVEKLSVDDADILSMHQLHPEVAETISRARAVLFVDATREGRPGEMRCRRVVPGIPDDAFSHHCTPASLLALARALYGRAPEAREVTLCGASFELGETLSPAIAAALPGFVDFITLCACE